MSADTRRLWAVLCVCVLYALMLLPSERVCIECPVEPLPFSVPKLPECSP